MTGPMSNIHLSRPDFVILGGYFALVLLIGMYFRRRQKTAQDYFAGGHQVSWWLAGISHYMSGFSAFTFVVYSEIAYRYGFVAIVLFWTSVPACILGGSLFASRWRRARIITPVEFLEQRCSLAVRQLFAWSAIPAKVFEDALKIFTTALFLSTGMGIGIKASIILCGAIVVIYTVLGGLLALVVTDYLQFLMKALAIALLLPLAVWRLGGLRPAFASIPPELMHAHGGPYGWIYITSYLLIVGISYNGSWTFAQKYYSVRDERSGQKAAYLAAFLNFVGTPIMLLPALMARKLMPEFAAHQKPQDVYVHLIFDLLPAGMVGIIVAALFSATMATVSADLNAIASVLTKDFYQRIVKPGASERRMVAVGRVITLLLGVCIIGISIWLAQSGRSSLFNIMVTAFGVLLAPTLLPLLATLVFRRLSSKGVLCGFIAGMACGIATLTAKTLYLAKAGAAATQALDYQMEGLSIFANILVTCMGMYIGSRFLATSPEESERTSEFFGRLATPISAQESHVTKRQSDSSSFIIRLSTVAVALLLIVSGLLAATATARWIDVSIGSALGCFGIPWGRVLRRLRSVSTTGDPA
jgi:solute:Na+ symporter, SSS family